MPRSQSFPTNCLYCGQTFLIALWQVAAGKGKYCSKACFLEAHKAAVILCRSCDNPIATKDSSYCSEACRGVAVREQALTRYADPIFKERWRKGIEKRSASKEWKASQRKGSRKRSRSKKYLENLDLGIQRRRNNPAWLNSVCRGPANPRWKGNQAARDAARKSEKYKTWRRAVFGRDNYICQHCKRQEKRALHAHHIKPWAAYPDLRYTISNGLTLCSDCHSELHGHYIPAQYSHKKRKKSRQLKLDL
jgi:5-methylcytosine-specific restriction endonuclease McrA